MFSETVTVCNPSGLHARPASMLAKLCREYECSIEITGGKTPVDPKSIISILSAGIHKGTAVTITAKGQDGREAVEAVADLIKSFSE